MNRHNVPICMNSAQYLLTLLLFTFVLDMSAVDGDSMLIFHPRFRGFLIKMRQSHDGTGLSDLAQKIYRQTSNISRAKFQN